MTERKKDYIDYIRIANQLTKVLYENNCTVEEAEHVLSVTQSAIKATALGPRSGMKIPYDLKDPVNL